MHRQRWRGAHATPGGVRATSACPDSAWSAGTRADGWAGNRALALPRLSPRGYISGIGTAQPFTGGPGPGDRTGCQGVVVAEPIASGLDVDGMPGGGPPVAVGARTMDWRFPSTAMSVHAMRRKLRPFLSSSELPEQDVDDLVLAACEAATNGIEHARHPAEPFFDVQAELQGHSVSSSCVTTDGGPRRRPNLATAGAACT